MVSGAVNDNLIKTAFVVAVTSLGWEMFGLSVIFSANLAALLFILPFIIFAGIAAHTASRLPPRQWLLILKFLEVLLASLAVVAILCEAPWILLFCILGFGIQSALIGPLKYALIPRLTSQDSLLSANAWMEAGTFIAILTGTIFGAEWIINSPIFLSVFICFLAVVGLASIFVIPKLSGNSFAHKQTLWQLIQQQRSDKRHMAAIWCISGFWGLGSVWITHLPILAIDIWQLAPNSIGTLLAYFVFGIALGSFLGVVMKSLVLKIRIFSGAIFIIIGSILTQICDYSFANIGLVVTAAGGGFLALPLYTMLQDDQLIVVDRIALNNVANASMILLGAVCSMLMVDLLKVPLLTWLLMLAFGQFALCFNHRNNLCLD